MSTVTMREMLQAGVHFGHQTRYWNPKMSSYLFGKRNKIHIINLEKTLPLYQEASHFIGKQAAKKSTILFVGTKRSAQKVIAEEAQRCGMPYINRRWLGGLLTNFRTIKTSINRLKEIEAMQSDGKMERLGKKEQLMLRRELERLDLNLSGIKDMKRLPDVLFIIDVGHENIAVNEAVKLKIPVVGIVDSNNSPNNIDYVIPGNDDATRSIALYAKGMADAVLEGRQSIAHLGGGEGDDLIEVDDHGSPVDVPVAKQKIAKKAKRKVVSMEPIASKEVDSAAQTAQADETVKVDDSKLAKSDKGDDNKTVKAVAKKKVIKKKVTKKVTMDNVDWTRGKLETLVKELNARFGTDQFKFNQQSETKKHISINGYKPRVNGQIYIVPEPLVGQKLWDVAPYGLSIEKTMRPYMVDLFKREPDGYKHPPDRQAFWRTDDFKKVCDAVDCYAKIMIEIHQ